MGAERPSHVSSQNTSAGYVSAVTPTSERTDGANGGAGGGAGGGRDGDGKGGGVGGEGG
jgi:hypothetical protein